MTSLKMDSANSAITDTQLGRQQQEVNEVEMAKRAKQNKKWNRRMKILFCCLGYKKNKDSIADVASIFAEFFYADLNVPSFDLAAGFVLLSKYQEAQRKWIVKNQQLGIDQYLSSVPITTQTRFLDISTAEDSHLINDLIYYMNYSLAIFGWPLQVFENPFSICCVCPYLKPSGCCGGRKVRPANADDPTTSQRSVGGDGQEKKAEADAEAEAGKLDEACSAPIVLGDNCCGCNVASIEHRLAAHNYEIIYFSYRVNVNVVPFFVAADHSKQSIVVAMRGSMSLSDMATDMNGQPEKLPIDDCPDDWLSHRGMTRAASHVKETLINESILDRAFNCRPELGSRDYSLVLTGHSLGAGVAAILGILMRKQYPTLKAYLYSPPGGLLSLPVVEYTKEFAIGILLGNDCVPRLGLAQLERLRYYVLLCLKNSQKSTGRILARALFPTCCLGGNKVDYDPNQSINVLYGNEGRSFDYGGRRIPFQVKSTVLYVPGRLIHVVKNYTFKSKARHIFDEPIYQAIWNENVDYDRVVVSDGMFYDHLPNILMHAMKMLFCKTLPARRESKLSIIELSCDQSQSNCIKKENQTTNEHLNKTKLVNGILEHRVVIDDDNESAIGRVDENNNESESKSKKLNYLTNNSNPSLIGCQIQAKPRSAQSFDPNLDVNSNDETVLDKNYH